MKKIYCISGLAADNRLFKNLFLLGYEFIPLAWVGAEDTDDMKHYAAKMALQITDTNPVIIGLSFGGMLAVEIAKAHPGWKIFIISSAKISRELGYGNALLRWVSRLKLVPAGMFNVPFFSTLYLLGARTPAERQLLKQIIKDSDPVFARWCVNTLLHWNNNTCPANVTHIHGTDDKVIRSSNVHPDQWIEKGSHIMIYNKAAEISKLIETYLSANH